MTNIVELPSDLLFQIFTFLNPKEIGPLGACCHILCNILNEERLWIFYCKREISDFEQKRKQIEKHIQDSNGTWKNFFKTQGWTFSSTLKASVLVLSNNDKTVSRPTAEGSNPVVMCSRPFSPWHCKYSVKIDYFEGGGWLAIGFCDETIQFNQGGVLGYQPNKLNGSIDSTGGIRFHIANESQNPGWKQESIIAHANRLRQADQVTVEINFDTWQLRYYVNDYCVGQFDVSHAKEKFLEGKVHPAVAMSFRTILSLVPH